MQRSVEVQGGQIFLETVAANATLGDSLWSINMTVLGMSLRLEFTIMCTIEKDVIRFSVVHVCVFVVWYEIHPVADQRREYGCVQFEMHLQKYGEYHVILGLYLNLWSKAV